MSSLPRRVNKPVYQRTPLAILQTNLAAIYAQLGYQNALSRIGDSRGIPLTPPAWVRAETWDAFAGMMPTAEEMKDLMEDIFARSKQEREEERARARAQKPCGCHTEIGWPHWNVVHGVATKACTKCGHVKNIGWSPRVIRGGGRDDPNGHRTDGTYEIRDGGPHRPAELGHPGEGCDRPEAAAATAAAAEND